MKILVKLILKVISKRNLGVEWDVSKDEFIFTFSDIIKTAESLPVTKRNILKILVMFFDPLGLVCPLVLQVKLFSRKYIYRMLNGTIYYHQSLYLNATTL